jgi:hypothetical protein
MSASVLHIFDEIWRLLYIAGFGLGLAILVWEWIKRRRNCHRLPRPANSNRRWYQTRIP